MVKLPNEPKFQNGTALKPASQKLKIWATISALALLVPMLPAQSPAPKPASIEGVVISSVTGEPVKKAMVTVQEAKSYALKTTITDLAGHFYFDSLTPGEYRISADKDGFQLTRSMSNQALPPITVAEDQHVQDVTMNLQPLATVSGHVLDEEGDPIIRATIGVLRYFYGLGPKLLNQVAVAQSNDQGEFEVLNVPPGRYYFEAIAPKLQNIPTRTRWTHAEEAYPIAFYPNGSDPSQGTATNLSPGAHITNIDFRLGKIPAYHVRGRVENGQRGLNSAVQLRNAWAPNWFGEAGIQADGSFDIGGIVNGAYELTIPEPRNAQLFARQKINVADQDVNNLVLTLLPGVSISGVVSVEGAPLGATGMEISLAGVDPRALMAADGSFTIQAVAPVFYELLFSNVPSGRYVKSIRFGDQDVKNGRLDLTSGAAAPLNIVLGVDGGEVDGTVQSASGAPAPATQVTLAPAEEYEDRTDLFKRAIADSSGNFQIKDVAPGEYKVFAWESDPYGSTESSEFRKPFESRSVAVTVGPKEKQSVQLNAITTEEVEKERSKLP